MDWLLRELNELKRQNLYRELKTLSSKQGKLIEVNGRKLVNFSSNDYLNLAGNFNAECLERWGGGSGASRLVCGNFSVHEELEGKLAKAKKTESALLFSSGYMANVGLIVSLAGSEDLILSDELNHASLIDGCRLSKAKKAIYPHSDTETLEFILSKERKKYRNCFIVTDAVFSMDGDLAKLDELFRIKEDYGCVLIIDDAHGTGVVGWSSLDVFGIKPDETTVIVGTLGKALGTFGAFVCGTKLLREYLINKCRTFIFTTALPPAVACQTLENLKKVPQRMKELQRKISLFRELSGINSQSAIFPLLVEDEEKALKLSAYLHGKGFYVPAIRPPSVKESRLRITVTCEHTKAEMEELLSAISEFKS